MDTVADFSETSDIFTTLGQVEHYARRRGRREVEIALSSGCLSPQSERVISEWLLRDDARQRRRASLPLWLFGLSASGLIAAWLAWVF